MRSDQVWQRFTGLLVASDAVLLGLAFVFAAMLRGAADVLPTTSDFQLDPLRYGTTAAILIPAMLVVFWLGRAYARHNLLGGPEEYARVASGCTYGTLLVVAASYLYGSMPIVSRGWLLLFWALAIVLVCVGRFTLRRIAYRLRRRRWFIRRVLICGASNQGVAIAQQLHAPVSQGIEVVGFLDDFLSPGSSLVPCQFGGAQASTARFQIVGHPCEAEVLTRRYSCDLLILVSGALSWESQQALAELAESAPDGLEVRLAPTQYDLTAVGVEPAPLGYIPLVRLQRARITGLDAALLTSIDVSLAALLLLIMGPIVGCVMAAAWLRGVSPIVERRQVIGQGGRAVTLWLLNQSASQRLLVRGLPALIAVLSGRLALVGPRPVPVRERAAYRHWAGLLLAVKPGLTGPWRLASPAASPVDRVMSDVWWVRNWTIWLHLFVLCQTVHRLWDTTGDDRKVARWETKEELDRSTPRLDLVTEL